MEDDVAPYALVEERPDHVEEHIEDPAILFVKQLKHVSVNAMYINRVSISSVDR